MSNIGTKIERLITEGFSYNTLRGLSESQVDLLYSRLISETTMVSITDLATQNKLKQEKKPFELYEDDDDDLINQYLTKKTSGQMPPNDQSDESNDGMDDDTNPKNREEKEVGMTEGKITEKFESKKQQKYFWWKCNNSKSEKSKKKWCKWAKEYSDKTNFKKLPEKKLEEGLTKLVEKYIPESITKKELMSIIESSTRTKEAPPKTTTKPKRKNPFEVKPHEKGKPKALATMGEDKKSVEGTDVFYNKISPNSHLPFKTKSTEMKESGAGAPAKAPSREKTREKETPSKPKRKNPFKIEPAQKPGPKATRKGPEWLSYNSFIKAGYRLK